MPGEKPVSLLLVEDHNLVLKGLKKLFEFERGLKVCGEASDGTEAISLASVLFPDVILLDIALPVLNGFDACPGLRKASPKSKIIILSAHSEDGYLERATEMGVSGFLVKQCSPNLLVEAIHRVAHGGLYFCPIVSKRLKSMQRSYLRSAVSAKGGTSLSPRETQVLQLIAGGLSNKEIAHFLQISVKTIEKHRQNLMNKLAIHDTASLMRYAISSGKIECSSQKTTIDRR